MSSALALWDGEKLRQKCKLDYAILICIIHCKIVFWDIFNLVRCSICDHFQRKSLTKLCEQRYLINFVWVLKPKTEKQKKTSFVVNVTLRYLSSVAS